MPRIVGPIRYAVRQFRFAPGFSAAAILTLALGIGGTTAIFSLMHAVMLRSLPVSDPSQLYRIGDGDNCCVQGGPQDRWGMFSFPLYERLVASAPELAETTAFQAGMGRLSVRRQGSDAPARPLRTEYVSGTYFSTLGVATLGGRTLTPEDDRPGSAPAVELSHHAWTTEFDGDPGIIGSTLIIDGHPFTVAGVAAPGFYGETLRGDPPDLWIPLNQEPLIAGESTLLRQPTAAWLRVIGRLRPGASADGMAPRLTELLRQWLKTDSGYPSNWMPDVLRRLQAQSIAVVPAGAGVASMKEQYGRSLQILLAVCLAVLLIACANVANLLLARAVARQGQTAIRLAIGASRRQIVWQALVESLVLAVGGALTGLFVASAAVKLLLSLAFRATRFLPIDTQPSLPMLAFAVGLAVLTGTLFGAAPAWFMTRTDPIDALRGAGRGTIDHGSFTRQALLVLQATLSVVLVAGAAMLARSFDRLEHQNLGYETRGRLLVSMNRPPASYTAPQLTAMYRRIEERFNQIPGVKGSGLALYNPLTDNWGELILVAGHPPPKLDGQAGSSWDRVSADYLQNLGIRLIRGRMFTAADNETTAPVAVVNETFVRRFFRDNEDPLEQHFGLDLPENAGTFRIVGVVADAKFASFTLDKAPRPMFFVPLTQNVDYPQALMRRIEVNSHFVSGLLLVSGAPPGAMEPVIRRALADVDPNLTIASVRTLEDQVSLVLGQQRAVASLAGLFGIIALLLAAVGLYGVTSYSVARRTNEIGIRMALGADRRTVVGFVMRSALARVGAGLLIGLPLAIGAGRLIAAQLYGVSFWDPVALGIAAAALAASACIAALIPATRAAGIAPMQALRTE